MREGRGSRKRAAVLFFLRDERHQCFLVDEIICVEDYEDVSPKRSLDGYQSLCELTHWEKVGAAKTCVLGGDWETARKDGAD